MKVPATCPGEQTKEERKKLKAERQEAANGVKSPTGPTDGVAELPTMSRSNTMNSLSSGYAASAHRSVSGVPPKTPTEETPPAAKPTISGPNTLRKNRVVAPPPAAYVSELPGSAVNGSVASNEQKGKMLYTYEANDAGELTVADGKEVTILEGDGKCALSDICSRSTNFE
jgi:hypothetical protein